MGLITCTLLIVWVGGRGGRNIELNPAIKLCLICLFFFLFFDHQVHDCDRAIDGDRRENILLHIPIFKVEDETAGSKHNATEGQEDENDCHRWMDCDDHLPWDTIVRNWSFSMRIKTFS